MMKTLELAPNVFFLNEAKVAVQASKISSQDMSHHILLLPLCLRSSPSTTIKHGGGRKFRSNLKSITGNNVKGDASRTTQFTVISASTGEPFASYDSNSSNSTSSSSFDSASKSTPQRSNSNGSLHSNTNPSAIHEEDPWKNLFPAYARNKDENRKLHHFINLDNSIDLAFNSLNGLASTQVPPLDSTQEASEAAQAAEAMCKETENFVTPPNSSALHPLAGQNMPDLIKNDPVWAAIRAEARIEAEKEPLLSSFLYASILAHSCFERSLSFVLADRLKNATLLATQLMEIFDDVLMQDWLRFAIRADVQAIRDRDPSCVSYSSALLFYKGYHALQAHRISHALWNRGQKVLALALQSRISEVFSVDIHPAARIGYAILLDHGTGVVIGETAVVGNYVSMLQGVTLGGTGKESGDRHPKIGDGVLIGAGATVLGNIIVGSGSMIAAGSLVLKDVAPHNMVAGTPARIVGTLQEPSPSLTMKHDATKEYYDHDFIDSESDYIFGAGI